MVSCYDIDGFGLSVAGPDEICLQAFSPALAAFEVSRLNNPDWSIIVEIKSELPAFDPECLDWEGLLPEGLNAAVGRRGNDFILLVRDHCILRSETAARRTLVTVRTGKEHGFQGTIVMGLLEDVLATAQRYLVHAACLVHPGRNEAILMFAPSGTGKTTAALALARGGLQLAGDDATLLRFAGDEPRVLGLPRGLRIHRRTATFLPWLSRVLGNWEGSNEQWLRHELLEGVVARASPVSRSCVRLILLDPPGAGNPVATTIHPRDALVAILHDNVRLAPEGLRPERVRFVDALVRLVQSTSTWRLQPGSDPGRLSPQLLGFEISSESFGDPDCCDRLVRPCNRRSNSRRLQFRDNHTRASRKA
jgi:hypothetical protein